MLLDELTLKRARYWSTNRWCAGEARFRFSLSEETLIKEHSLDWHNSFISKCPICQVEVAVIVQDWRDEGLVPPRGFVRYYTREKAAMLKGVV